MLTILILVLVAWLWFLSVAVVAYAKVLERIERRITALEASTAAHLDSAPPAGGPAPCRPAAGSAVPPPPATAEMRRVLEEVRP